jgi:hypothetical protein
MKQRGFLNQVVPADEAGAAAMACAAALRRAGAGAARLNKQAFGPGRAGICASRD